MRAPVVLLCALGVGLGGCGPDEPGPVIGGDSGRLIQRDPTNAERPPVAMGSKNFTEQYVLAEIYAQALEAAGYRVPRRLDVGAERATYAALRAGRVDAYPEYTGTILNGLFGVALGDVPSEPETAYAQARRAVARHGIAALAITPFSDSNGFAMTREGARRAGNARRLSDLARRAPGLVLAGPPECRARADCLAGLRRTYGIRFGRFLPVEPDRRHAALRDGRADVLVVFTTEGQIKTEDLVLLEDDRRLFPPYNVSLLVRDEALRAAGPDLREVVEFVGRGLTVEVMQELNSRVDIDGQKPVAVAREYLVEAGHLPAG